MQEKMYNCFDVLNIFCNQDMVICIRGLKLKGLYPNENKVKWYVLSIDMWMTKTGEEKDIVL